MRLLRALVAFSLGACALLGLASISEGAACTGGGGEPAFRAISNVSQGTRTNTTVTEPTGTTTNDIMVIQFYIESDTAVTPPTGGWSDTFRSTVALVENNTAGAAYRQYAFWIRRGGAAPDLTITHASAFTAASVITYSGAVTTEQPWSFLSLAQRDDSSASTWPATSGTTLTANECLLWTGGFFTSTTTSGTPPTGYTEQQDIAAGNLAFEIAELAQVAAGSTGSVSGASWTGGSAAPSSVIFAGLKAVAEPAAATTVPQRTMTGVGL